jgi:RimJ/RimL family protein N-acetyltransferase
VTSFDFTPYEGLEERLRRQGIQVKTYAELEGDPRRMEKLWALDLELWQDVPYGEPVTRPSLERFEVELILHPDFIPEACFVVVAGEEYAGYSLLLRGEDYYDTDMTGVRREFRGRGVATLLKLLGVRYALDHGGHEIRTVNDTVNGAILSLNDKLGFQRQGANIRYIKKL